MEKEKVPTDELPLSQSVLPIKTPDQRVGKLCIVNVPLGVASLFEVYQEIIV